MLIVNLQALNEGFMLVSASTLGVGDMDLSSNSESNTNNVLRSLTPFSTGSE